MRFAVLSVLVLAATLFAPATFAQDAPTETASSVVVGFPGLEAARAAMIDEEVEPYISTLQTAEMTETSFLVEFRDLQNLAQAKKELKERFSPLEVSFIDNEGLI